MSKSLKKDDTQEMLAAQAAKNLKKIPVKQLELGGIYSTGNPKKSEKMYLGKMKTRDYYGEEKDGLAFAVISGDKCNIPEPHLDFVEILKSPSFKLKVGQESVDEWIDRTINYYAKAVNEAIKEKSWGEDYYKRKLNHCNQIKEELNK